jgi:ribosomal protein S18 acetylase RimI-like enzyme
MNESVEFGLNRASEREIADLLRSCDADFIPPLSQRVQIDAYARKIIRHAERFEAWVDGKLIGLVAAYCNDPERRLAHITSVSVGREWTGRGIAGELMSRCMEHVRAAGMKEVTLEVAPENAGAVRLYQRCGFVTGPGRAPFVTMRGSVPDLKTP